MTKGMFIFGIVVGLGLMSGIVLVIDPTVFIVEKVVAIPVLAALMLGAFKCYKALEAEYPA